jgi:hypothetical protein
MHGNAHFNFRLRELFHETHSAVFVPTCTPAFWEGRLVNVGSGPDNSLHPAV